ncbi:glycosyltransferase family 2 protein [Psychromonas sp. PT13]|uniref:glycosyltransferase family 2 protein n=1 Tax=Psychromonas sp. PT13 TaxID=3439547 RepID=UPI003EBC2AD0
MNNLVSVISPAYNAEKHLRKLVECVASQSIRVLEHIIIDDGSTDDSLRILRSLEKKYPHIKIISQENQGAGVARNKGIAVAQGKYIAFLDSDDVWAEDKLRSQIEFMENENIAFSYGDYYEVDDESGDIIKERRTPEFLTYHDLLKSCPIGCLTVAFNQYELGKLYMPAIRRGQDWALWLQIMKSEITAYRYSGILASYTVVKGSLSKNKVKKAFNMYKIYRSQNLSYFQSIYYLLCFTFAKLRK